MKYRILALAAVLPCVGCVSVFEGTSQKITINTNPPGATCGLERHGEALEALASTPGTVTVRKSKYDIMITCTKPGYEAATYLNHSGTTDAIAANVAVDVVLTLGISSIIDSADGADNRYDGVVNITMNPVSTAQR